MPPLKFSRDSIVNDVQLNCQQVMNDLLTIIKVGQHRSRMTRLIIITARRFLASKNQFQLPILEFSYLGHRIASLALYSIHICRSNKGQMTYLR